MDARVKQSLGMHGSDFRRGLTDNRVWLCLTGRRLGAGRLKAGVPAAWQEGNPAWKEEIRQHDLRALLTPQEKGVKSRSLGIPLPPKGRLDRFYCLVPI